MKDGTRERLRKRGKSQAAQAEEADTFHNHQVPCCRLIQECSSDIFPEDCGQSSSLLSSLIRRHLRGSSKKKKKRKKKRKSDDEPEEVAENPPADPNMESQQDTTEIMHKWLDRTDDSCPKNRDLNSFLLHLQSPVVTIDASRLQAACESISCLACQHSTRQSTLSQNIPIGPSCASKTFVPSSLTIDGGDVEWAFDYVAMEEGDSEEIILVLHRNGSMLQCDTLSVEQLEQCVRQIVVPCGLPETEDSNAYELSEKEFLQVTNNVTRTIRNTRVDLDTISNALVNVRVQLDESAAMTCSFDVKTSTTLRDCDSLLDGVLHELVVVVRHTQTTLCDGHFVQDLMGYLRDTVSTILEAQQAHEGQLVQLANRPGVVPQMALNATHRSSYRDFLAVKLDSLCTLETQLESLFFGIDAYRTLVGYSVLEKLVYNNKSQATPEDDHLWQLYEEQTHTVHCGNIREMREIRYKRCDDLLEAISQRRSARCHQIFEVIARKKVESPELVETRAITYEQATKEEDFPQFRENVMRLFANEVTQARVENVEKVIMPLKLKQWLRGQVTDSCVGGGGRLRVTCILTGLLYKWLVDRCNEWHAELTQNELLEYIVDDPVVPEPKPKGKKSKKKKKIVATCEEASRSDVANENMDRSTEGTFSKAVDESTGAPNACSTTLDKRRAGVQSDDADDLPAGKENHEHSARPHHSSTNVAMASKNGKKDKVVAAITHVEKAKESSPSHDSREQGASDQKVTFSTTKVEKAKKSSPSHGSREPVMKSDKKVASTSHVEKAKKSSPSHDSREQDASDQMVASSTMPIDKTKKSSPRHGPREPGTKSEKKVSTATTHVEKAKKSSPSRDSREQGASDQKVASSTTQFEKAKKSSSSHGSRESGTKSDKKVSTATTQVEEAKQSSPSHDSREPRAKTGKKSAPMPMQVNSGEPKQQSGFEGSHGAGASDKGSSATTQVGKAKQSSPIHDSRESRVKSCKKLAPTPAQVYPGESKQQFTIEGSAEGVSDEKAASAATHGAKGTKKSTESREPGASDKKLTSTASQIDSEKGESSLSRCSAETAVDVGVVSSTGFQSAEGFLVERLMVVLRAEKHENSTKT